MNYYSYGMKLVFIESLDQEKLAEPEKSTKSKFAEPPCVGLFSCYQMLCSIIMLAAAAYSALLLHNNWPKYNSATSAM